jgi:hypothetical protein
MFLFKNLSTIASAVRNVFTDNFNRSDAGDLGYATDGSKWEALRGVFTIFGNKAKATSAASTYPIASITMPDSPLDQDVVITLKGTDRGTGAALWITDSNNWWAVTTGQDVGENCECDTCSTCNAGNCNAGPCTTNGNCISGNCNVNGDQQFIAGNPNLPTGNNPTSPTPAANYGYNQAGGNCSGYNCPTTGNRFCRASSCSQLGEPVCLGWQRLANYRSTPPRNIISWRNSCTSGFTRPCVAWTCNAYNFGNCNSQNCANTNPVTYGINTYNFTNPNPNNPTVPGFVNAPTGTGVYNCAGTFCSGTYNCAAYTCTAWTCTNTTWSACNCNTCYPTYIRLIRSISNTVSQVFKWKINDLGTSVVNSLRITTSGDQLTIEPFANNDLTGKIGSDLVYTPTGVVLTSVYGIIVEPSPTNQGNQIDEITIEKI